MNPYLDAIHRELSATPVHPSLPRARTRLGFRAAMWWTLNDMDLGKGRRDVAGHAPSWCTTFLLAHWRVVSLPANALVAVVGSSPPIPVGGGRSYHDRRHSLRPQQLSFTISSSYRPSRSPRSSTTDALTVSPTHIVSQLVGRHDIAYAATTTIISLGIASGQGLQRR